MRTIATSFIVLLCCAGHVFAEEPDPRVLRAAIVGCYWSDSSLTDEQKKEAHRLAQSLPRDADRAMITRFLDGDTTGIDEAFLPQLKMLTMKVGKKNGEGYQGTGSLKEDADAFGKRCWEYYVSHRKKGEQMLVKAWRGEELTPADWDVLEDYTIYEYVRRLSLAMPPKIKGLMGMGPWGHTPPSPYGTPFPDLQLPFMETVLRRSSYTDKYSFDPYDPVQPHNLVWARNMIEGYRIEDGKVHLNLLQPGEGETAEDYLRISDFRGKKAVMLINTYPLDCSGPYLTSVAEVLQRAYGEHLAVIMFSNNWFHFHWPYYDYFEPSLKRKRTHHLPKTMEESARNAKIFSMTFPTVSFPVVLDSLSQHGLTVVNGGPGEQISALLDKEGRLVYWDRHSLGGNYPVGILIGNKYEDEIQKLAANGWKADAARIGKAIGPFKSHHPAAKQTRNPAFKDRKCPHDWGPERVYIKDKKTGNLVTINPNWFCGEIMKVDTRTGIVEVKHHFDPLKAKGYQFWKKHLSDNPPTAVFQGDAKIRYDQCVAWENNPPDKVYKFQIDKETELFLNGWEVLPDELSKYKPGDRVGIKYDPKLEGRDVIRAWHFRASRLPEQGAHK